MADIQLAAEGYKKMSSLGFDFELTNNNANIKITFPRYYSQITVIPVRDDIGGSTANRTVNEIIVEISLYKEVFKEVLLGNISIDSIGTTKVII